MPRKRTRYDELDLAAMELTDAEIHEGLRQLSRDDRFAAVVAWLARTEHAWRAQVGDTATAADAGQLASKAGSMGAVIRLQSQLRSILQKVRETPPPTPAD